MRKLEFEDHQALRDLAKSKGWEILVEKLNEKLASKQSQLNSPERTPDLESVRGLQESTRNIRELIDLPETLGKRAPEPEELDGA